jgi:hypothetical protein
MTLGPKQEHPMKAKREQQSPPDDIERFRKELGLKIQRLVAESLEGWSTCENKRCRREKRCASGNRECIVKWQEPLPPLPPEEAEARMEDFRIAVAARKRLGGDSCTEEQLMEAIREERARRGMPPQAVEPLAPVVDETQLAPEKQERIDRAWNDYVASSPAEEENKREPGPRITQL